MNIVLGKKVEAEFLATGLSTIFDLNYEETLEKVNSSSSVSVIAKKVEKDVISTLETWMSDNKISTGINIDEDSKRYYPYGSLASNVIGFCGTEKGLEGLESKWNSLLTGTSGKIVTTAALNKEAISDENQLYVAAENGSNIHLTIDTAIQRIAEKYLEQGVIENKAVAGNAILMNPNTGDIYAMANYPYYDLNEPFSADPTGLSSVWDTLSTEEKTANLNAVWRNKAVSDGYEPGSTFKLITSSIALEEGLVQTDSANDFYCSGVETVADEPIKCWRDYKPHYHQTLRDALENSCNPAFIQLGQRIGVDLFYKYLNAFGLLEKTNAGFAGEANSIFYPEEKMGSVELATMSFGQRFTITPLQLITAVSAIANDGVLVKPKIISKIENSDTKEITTIETEEVRQVISKQTAKQVKNMMESVVTNGTGQNARIEGYSIGGKSGTSEPRRGKEEDGYVASFIAISPIENTQVVCLVILYKPDERNHQGGQTAAPIVNQILKEVLPHLGIASSTESDKEELYDSTILANLKGKTIAEARSILENNGFRVKYSSGEDESTAIVTDQSPKGGAFLFDNALVCLYSEESPEKEYKSVPNLKGLTPQEAINALKSNNLNINIEGTKGIVISQSPSYYTDVEEGTIINVVIKEELIDGQ